MISAGDRLSFGGEVSTRIIFPALASISTIGATGLMATSTNFAYSLASAPEVLFDLSYANTRVVFLGNSSHKVQEYLAGTSSDMKAADVVIVSNSALPVNMSARLVSKLSPKFLVYSKQPSSTSATAPKPLKSSTNIATSTGKSLKKKVAKIPVDSLASISLDHRLNLKELGTIHLVSDGISLTIK